MLMSQEWFGFASARKTLRVTDPLYNQRSTYRLQLPYKYGIPLLLLSALLHWLVSQSLFLVEVQAYTQEGVRDGGLTLTALGYSNIAIMTTILLGGIAIVLGIGMGFRIYEGGMPLVGSCSAAISAACHQPSRDTDAATKALMWGVAVGKAGGSDVKGRASGIGVVEGGSGVLEGDNGKAGKIGHCSFTSLPAEPPREGEVYAGRASERAGGRARARQ